MDTNPITILPTTVLLNPKEDVQTVGANLSQLDEDFSLIIDILNLSNLTVKEVIFQVKFSDSFGKYLFDGAEFQFLGSEVQALPHKIYYFEPFILDDRFHTARSVEIRIASVTYEDDTKQDYILSTESAYVLPIITLEKSGKISEVFGKNSVTYGENMMTAWRCVCGATNEREATECRNCGRNKNFVLNNLTEPLMNIKLLNMMESKEPNSVDLSLTQTLLTKAAETTQIIQEKRLNPQEKKKSKQPLLKNIRPATVFIILTLASILAIGMFSFLKVGYQRSTIKNSLANAEELLTEGKYEKALSIYKGLDQADMDSDIPSLIEKAERLVHSKNAYNTAEKLSKEEKYIAAVEQYQQVLPEDSIHYKKAQDKILMLEKSLISYANSLLEEGKKEEVLNILDRYLAVMESADALNLKESITKSQISAVKEALVEEAKKQEEEEEQKIKEDTDRALLSEKSKDLLHSYQTVVATNANLRETPSLEGNIITTFPVGTDVYIFDTLVEGTERVWCKVEALNHDTGIVSEGWISSRVLESTTIEPTNSQK